LVVTKDGCEVITRFPAEELLIAGVRYYTATGPLAPTREIENHKNIQYGNGDRPWEEATSKSSNHRDAVVTSAKGETVKA
jgi:hypothetical protein